MSTLRRRRRSRRPGWKTRETSRQRYMSSSAWFTRRLQWFNDEAARTGKGVTCPGCGRRLTPRGCDMHHATYERLGYEKHLDLIALCRPCHELLHRHLDANWRVRRWINANPGANTRTYVARLRQKERNTHE